jgi:nucleoside-diphosphate-sugar epimerase
MSKNVIIIGGHGKVSLRLAKLISKTHTVTSVIRDPDQIKDIENVGATPLVLSLEDSPSSDFATAFRDRSIDVVVFSAGAGGKGGAERTKKVDYEGALKIFDAIELVENNRPRLLLVSAVDVRSSSITPPWYVSANLSGSFNPGLTCQQLIE